jgi:copper(I)-binding protein
MNGIPKRKQTMRPVSRRRAIGLALGCVALSAWPVLAHDGHGNESATPDATPALPVNTGTGAVYLTIINHGDSADRLISATTAAAQTVEIHSMSIEGNVMRMQELANGLEIPPGETVTLDRDNLHLMLVNLNHDLAPDSIFDMELTFETAGTIVVQVKVTMAVPEDDAVVSVGDLEIGNAWSRPAPMLTSVATPAG